MAVRPAIDRLSLERRRGWPLGSVVSDVDMAGTLDTTGDQRPAHLADAVAVGVDVGADRLHVVVLDAAANLVTTAVLDPLDRATVDKWFAALAQCSIGIDGPAGPSVAAFANDPSVSNKFRRARGCEVELGRQRGIWVSFATGPEPLTGWMAEAARVHDLVAGQGHHALETYPHGIYRTLLGRRPAKKTMGTGVIERVEVLRNAGINEPALAMWSHDALDAAAAAIAALHHHWGIADEIRCDLDGTSVWLPASATATTAENYAR